MKKRTLRPRAPGGPVQPIYWGLGLHDRPGHYAWLPGFHQPTSEEPYARWLRSCDGLLPPPDDNENEGRCVLFYVRGNATVIACWDRSVDKRNGSNSVWLLPGVHTFDGAMGEARKHWPESVTRLRVVPMLVHDALNEEVQCLLS